MYVSRVFVTALVNSIAYIAVYTREDNKNAMFDRAALVFKNGRLILTDFTVYP